MKTITALTLAAAIIAPALAPMLANAAPSDLAQVKVSFGDLNLNRARDAAVLLKRVQSAALDSCGVSGFSLPDYRDAVQRSSCYRDGVAQAVAAINAPKLTSLYIAQATSKTANKTLALAFN